MTDRDRVRRWIAGYEGAWRSPSTDTLAQLFAEEGLVLAVAVGRARTRALLAEAVLGTGTHRRRREVHDDQ